MKTLFPVLSVFSCLIAAHSFAGSATWSSNAVSGDWNTAANWTPATVPNGPNDIATFATSNVTNVSFSANTEISQIIFASDASAYNLTVEGPFSLTVAGTGITNFSKEIQHIDLEGSLLGDGQMLFHGNSSAGSGTIITARGGFDLHGGAGVLEFHNASSADSSILVATEEKTPALSGKITFFGHSTAGMATINLSGFGTTMIFTGSTTGDQATISATLGGDVRFVGHSNVGSAKITADNLGNIYLGADAYAGAAASIVCENAGTLGVDGKNDVPVELRSSGNLYSEIFVGSGRISKQSIGSLAGYGFVNLSDGSTFIIGSNNLSTEFAGGVYGPDFGVAALSKVGTGSLTLSGANGYHLGTTVTSGLLMITDMLAWGILSGPVQINGGTLAGSGTIDAEVIIGSGTGTGGLLAPGESSSNPRTLTIQNVLRFKGDGTYTYKLNTNKATADEVIAKRVIIESGARFEFNDIGTKKLTSGTVFIPISNTATTIINGAFTNLADGTIVTVGANKFQVSYSGGDGNDLTLTVVQ